MTSYEITFTANVDADTREEAVEAARELILDHRYEPSSVEVQS